MQVASKVWTFGWGVHTQDLDEGSASRTGVTELVPWLHAQFAAQKSPTGRSPFRFASYIEVRDEYLAWEKANPGTSSFDYRLRTADYAAYPYLEWANRYLRATSFQSDERASDTLRAFRLSSDGHPLVLLLGEGTFDASALGATVRRVDLASGAATEVASGAVAVGPAPTVVCVAADCDAILEAGAREGSPGPRAPEGSISTPSPAGVRKAAGCSWASSSCTRREGPPEWRSGPSPTSFPSTTTRSGSRQTSRASRSTFAGTRAPRSSSSRTAARIRHGSSARSSRACSTACRCAHFASRTRASVTPTRAGSPSSNERTARMRLGGRSSREAISPGASPT